jgi:hypothetical protein
MSELMTSKQRMVKKGENIAAEKEGKHSGGEDVTGTNNARWHAMA